MARSGTSYQKGQSGNLSGRPPANNFRRALRAELGRPSPENPSETRYAEWARKIVDEASKGSTDQKMEVMKFLEGTAPADKGEPPGDLDESETTDEHGNSIDP